MYDLFRFHLITDWTLQSSFFLNLSSSFIHFPHQSPIFLLFLDCVHQLIEQFPSAFEFTDTFLIALWDSMHSGIFGTFLFNSERHRMRTCVSSSKGQYQTTQLATVWAWTLQFTKDDQALFTNPLYIAKSELKYNDLLEDEPDYRQGCNAGIYRSIRRLNNGKSYIGSDFKEMDSWTFNGGKRRKNPNVNGANSASSVFANCEEEIIIPLLQTPTITLWNHCYLRWVPSVHTVGGGSPAIYQQQCRLVGRDTATQRDPGEPEGVQGIHSRASYEAKAKEQVVFHLSRWLETEPWGAHLCFPLLHQRSGVSRWRSKVIFGHTPCKVSRRTEFVRAGGGWDTRERCRDCRGTWNVIA